MAAGSRAYFGDVAVFTVASGDMLGTISEIQFEEMFDSDEGGAIPYLGASPQYVGSSGRLRTQVMSNVVGVGRVSDLDVSAFTIGGTTYRAKLKSGRFACGFDHQETSGRGDEWKAPQVTNKSYSGTFELFVDASAAPDLLVALNTGAMSRFYVAFSVTINGITITLPVMLTGWTWGATYGSVQTVSFNWEGRNPLTGAAYPTAPTGTTTLLEKALNDPLTPIAFTLRTKASTSGVIIAGNMCWESAEFSIDERKVIKNSYSWLTVGTVTFTAGT